MIAKIRRREVGRFVWMVWAVLVVLLIAGCASDRLDATASDGSRVAADAAIESVEAEGSEPVEAAEAELAETAEVAESVEAEAAELAEEAEAGESAEAELGELAEDQEAEEAEMAESAEAEAAEAEEGPEASAADAGAPEDGDADDVSELPPVLFSDDQLAHFEATIESLREALRIAAISAAVVRDGELIWAEGFGTADLEEGIAATPDTPYGLASVTKPFAAFLLMRLVEDGLLDLDAPAVEYGIDLGNPAITIRQLLTHTSEGAPGSRYKYSGDRYAMLTPVIEQLYGGTFRNVLRREILDPLGMTDTALNVGGCGPAHYIPTLVPGDPERAFEHVYRDAAVPYQYDETYDVYPVPVPTYANAAAGLISTVVDLAAFAAAIERDELVAPETKNLMFAPTVLCSGAESPYGLGWFTERDGETELIWHYGYGAYSSLFLMVPSEGLTFIILANTQNMSRPFGLGLEGVSVLGSPFALAFFKAFVLQPRFDEALPEIDWTAETPSIVEQLAKIEDPELRALYEDELWVYRKLYAGVGEARVVNRLTFAHLEAFPDVIPTTDDVYQVGRPGPRPDEVEAIALTAKQAARWTGRYALRPEDAASGLPPEMEIVLENGRIIAVVAVDDCQAFVAVTPFRLASANTPGLFLVGEEGDRPFASGAVEHAGTIIAVYERVE